MYNNTIQKMKVVPAKLKKVTKKKREEESSSSSCCSSDDSSSSSDDSPIHLPSVHKQKKITKKERREWVYFFIFTMNLVSEMGFC